MKEVKEGSTVEKAAMRSGMSETTARRYRDGAPPKGKRPPREYRTRVDPFAAVWPGVETMLEEAPGLDALAKRLAKKPGNAELIPVVEAMQRALGRKQPHPRKKATPAPTTPGQPTPTAPASHASLSMEAPQLTTRKAFHDDKEGLP
jgi:hypothetical protein